MSFFRGTGKALRAKLKKHLWERARVVKLLQLPALHYRGAELGSYKIGDFATKKCATPSTRRTIMMYMYWAQVR